MDRVDLATKFIEVSRDNSQIFHRSEHGQQTQHQPRTPQAISHTSLAWFPLPYSEFRSYYT